MSKLRELFSIDLRSLALFRILLGALLACDLVLRAGDIEAWYTDFGVLPVAAWRALCGGWSFHALRGALWFEVLLFTLAGLFAIALAVGFHSRIAILACWVLTLSMLNRNPFVQGGSAVSLQVILFWSLTLPLGARWSIDRLRKTPLGAPPSESTARTILSLGTVFILLQILLIYPMLVIEKLRAPCCWRNLTAVSRVLADDRTATWISRLLRNIPWAHKPMAAAVLSIESVPPFLAFSPVATPRIRTGAVFCLMFFHAVCMPSVVSLGVTFPGVMTTMWTLFLPPWFWDEAVPQVHDWLKHRIQGFDGTLAKALAPMNALLARIPRREEEAKAAAPWLAPARAAVSALLVASFCFVVLENGRAVAAPRKKRWELPKLVNRIAGKLGLRQGWALYVAPRTNRTYVFAATLSDGTRVDLNSDGRELDWAKPRMGGTSGHWTKLETNISNALEMLAPLFTDYLARDWDRDHPERVVESLDLSMTNPYEENPPKHTLLWHREFDDNAKPQLNRDWSKAAFALGKPVTITMTLDARSLDDRRCKMPSDVDGMSCESHDDDSGGASLPLRPFTRLEGTPFLASEEPLSPLVKASRRLVVDCTLSVQAFVDDAEVMFEPSDPWFKTQTKWPIGTLSDCKRASTRTGKRTKPKKSKKPSTDGTTDD